MNIKRGVRLVAAALAGVVLVVAYATPSFAAPFWEGQLRTHKLDPNGHTLVFTTGVGIKSQAYVNFYSGSRHHNLAFTYDGAVAGWNYILERGNNMTLSVHNNSGANGAAVVSYPYQVNNRYQMWRVMPDGSGRIQNLGTGKCLAVAGGTGPINSGSKVILWSCSSGFDQIWSVF